MIFEKIICLLAALCIGGMFSYAGVPAGWLLGGLLTGMTYGLFIKRYAFEGWPFRTVLAFVGVNIGFMMQIGLFQLIGQYFFPLVFSLFLTLAAGAGLGWLMNRFTYLDPLTAYFCCVPGGASEVIALSSDYGADNRVVAAFHTARITFFVLTIPFVAGRFYQDSAENNDAGLIVEPIDVSVLTAVIIGVLVTIGLYQRWKIPAGTLFYGIMSGFVLSEWVLYGEAALPSYVGGIGQALIGIMVGIRFDKPTFLKLKDIGKLSVILLGLYFLFSLVLAGLFTWMTELPYMTSLLSTVPAGAAEMSSTAMALHLEPTLVAGLQMIRVVALFLFLPVLINILNRAAEQERQ
ncbi:hypothetical protein SAMN05192534_11465 [Alteribacillus persepolensis]|uniref:Membrane protein AbrB duplication n=1 Tax=Alteribacillus persepolensis TaxID=568899 RepID=A0A1G8G6V0_9BACI|nr:AbrB family transcriptional regulator [Alteribacillus persepolensis]SDH90124.1 hypothetical protein SAMN05192534_11465 [Alteribacillus persepolensis]